MHTEKKYIEGDLYGHMAVNKDQCHSKLGKQIEK